MKTKLLLLMLCFFVFGCKKNPFDYRTKYLGNYVFVVHSSSYNPLDGLIDTTFSINGEIEYGSEKNTILISFGGSTGTDFKIYEDGTVDINYCSGEFETTDKLVYSCYRNESPSAHSSLDVEGEKK